MKLGDQLVLGGFITQRKFVLGHSLADIERLLGFEKGRLSSGAYIAVLNDLQPLPMAADFELRGYSQGADHRWDNSATAGYNMEILKKIAMNGWERTGPDSLVKIISINGHNNSIALNQQYPPGAGVPQWKLVKGLLFNIVSLVTNYPEGRWIG